ncbi:TolC family protein, partial [uncultured Muribaculum sp.]
MRLSIFRYILCSTIIALPALSASAQEPPSSSSVVTLDSCRAMAVANNKQMRIQAERIKAAGYQKKEAFAAYLPSIDFAGGYTYNQKDISIFDSDQFLPVKNFDMTTQQYEYSLVTNPETGMPIKGPDGQYVPSSVAYLPKEAMTYDIHNVFFGAVTLTQPVYMGGKIVAMNKITKYAEELARSLHDSGAEDIIYA